MKIGLRLLFGCAFATTFSASAMAAELGAVNEPIKLAVNEWTGAQVTTRIAGALLEQAGYKVDYVTAGSQNQWQAIWEGQLDAAMENYSSNIGAQYADFKKAGKVEELGELGLDARDGFVYPGYVADLCPGLPKWEALVNCAPIFATADTLPLGRLVDYPADWGTPGADRVKALKLPFKALPAGSEGALIAEFRAATERKTPILSVFWRPHWAIKEFDLKFVELPPGDPACYTDPSYGPNKDATGDCDFIKTSVFKAVWPGLKAKWPAAYEILKAVTLTNADQEPLVHAIDVDGKSVEDVTAQWVKDNADRLKPIVDGAKK